MLKTLGSQCRGPGFDPGLGSKILHATWYSRKKKERNKNTAGTHGLRLCMSFWGAAIAEYHKEGLRIVDLFSCSSRGQESEARMLTGP